MIEIKEIKKSFGKLNVLKNISLELHKGESLALIGPNGCGKTTLIKCVLGMVIPESGSIIFEGKAIGNHYQYREEIGYMPQIGHYPDNMTIGHIIEMITQIRKSDKTLDEDLLNAFQLKDMYHKKMSTLSGGTTQKVSATLAFLFDPKVLILDEPTAGLDPISSEILKEKIVLEKSKGKLILITSHILSELDELITGLVLMQDGEIKLKENIEELRVLTDTNSIAKAITKILKEDNNATNHQIHHS